MRYVRCGIGGEGWRAGGLTRAVELRGLTRRPCWRLTVESVSGAWTWIVGGLLLGRLRGCSFEGVVGDGSVVCELFGFGKASLRRHFRLGFNVRGGVVLHIVGPSALRN